MNGGGPAKDELAGPLPHMAGLPAPGQDSLLPGFWWAGVDSPLPADVDAPHDGQLATVHTSSLCWNSPPDVMDAPADAVYRNTANTVAPECMCTLTPHLALP